MEVSKETLNNVGILTSNIRDSCMEDLPQDDEGNIIKNWNGLEEFEQMYNEAGKILEQLKITFVDHTKGIVEVKA